MPQEANPSEEELQRRKKWFAGYIDRLTNHSVVRKRQEGNKYACPCCGYLTLDERGGDEICPVCFWEDDGQDDEDADTVRGGPNRRLSLTQARSNFRECGASEARRLKNVRPPHEEEKP